MPITVNINGLSLSHKNDSGWVRSTLPDVCRTNGSPVPYVNMAFVKDLENGTVTVFADGGGSCAIKGSEFSKSIGDEPGAEGGVTSGVHLDRATWLSWSPNVFAEGEPLCRLTDKMLLNRGNTISAGGYQTVPLPTDKAAVELLCLLGCICRNLVPKLPEILVTPQKTVGPKTQCVDRFVELLYYKGVGPAAYPQPNSPLWREVVFAQNGVLPNGDPNWELQYSDKPQFADSPTPSNNWFVPGSRRPDFVYRDPSGNIQDIIEMKFPPDDYGRGQEVAYDQIAKKYTGKEEHTLIQVPSKKCKCPGNEELEAEVASILAKLPADQRKRFGAMFPGWNPVPAPAGGPSILDWVVLIVLGVTALLPDPEEPVSAVATAAQAARMGLTGAEGAGAAARAAPVLEQFFPDLAPSF